MPIPAMTKPPVMETIEETTQTKKINWGEGRILIMMAGTIKIPLPMIVPITMPRQESRLSLWGVLMEVERGLEKLREVEGG